MNWFLRTYASNQGIKNYADKFIKLNKAKKNTTCSSITFLSKFTPDSELDC